MTTPNLEGALCVGNHELFDSTHPIDHAAARRICLGDPQAGRPGCPVRLTCHGILDDLIATSNRHANHRPTGTWAGKLIGEKPNPAQCGTNQGYYRHRRMHEALCDDCREAHRLHERARIDKKRAEAAA